MRFVKNALLVLFALAVVAVGAVMPFAASRWQDAQQAGVEARPFDSFLLTLRKKGELSQFLRFLNENYYYVYMEEAPENAALSADEARDAAMETVELMFRSGLISKGIFAAIESNKAAGVDEPDVDMARITARGDLQDSSFIVWGVDWYNLGLQVWLDDASGKAYQISCPGWLLDAWDDVYYDGNASSTGMLKEQFYLRMEDWNFFVHDYYEVEIVDIEEVLEPMVFRLYIDLQDGGDPIPVQLYMDVDGDTLAFLHSG